MRVESGLGVKAQKNLPKNRIILFYLRVIEGVCSCFFGVLKQIVDRGKVFGTKALKGSAFGAVSVSQQNKVPRWTSRISLAGPPAPHEGTGLWVVPFLERLLNPKPLNPKPSLLNPNNNPKGSTLEMCSTLAHVSARIQRPLTHTPEPRGNATSGRSAQHGSRRGCDRLDHSYLQTKLRRVRETSHHDTPNEIVLEQGKRQNLQGA